MAVFSRADFRWTQPHLTTWDESQAPRFAWPAEVTQRYNALKKGDSASIATLVDAGMGTLTLSNEATFVSQGQGKKGSVMFVNETDEPIQRWWVKPDGSLKDYGQIAKRFIASRSTFDGHV